MVTGRARRQTDGLDLDLRLVLPRLALFLGLFVGKLAVIQHPADGRVGVRRYLDQVQFRFFGDAQGIEEGQYTPIDTVMVDQAHFARPNLPIDPKINGVRFSNWRPSYSLNLPHPRGVRPGVPERT